MLSRRGLAVAAASATLSAGFVSPIVSAHAAAPVRDGALDARILGLDGLLGGLLGGLVPGADVQKLIAGLGLEQLGDLLEGANLTQLQTLLDGLTAGQLDGALGTLSPDQILAVLGPLTGGDAAQLFALLDPSQISGLLQLQGGLGEVVEGLRAVVASLLADTPLGVPVDDLLVQLQTVLAGISPDQLGALDPLFAQLGPLLEQGGFDPAQLANLTALLQGFGDQTGLAGLTGLLGILAPAGVPTDPSTDKPLPPATVTPKPAATPTPSAPTGPSATPGATAFAARAAIGKPKVAKNRRSARFKLTCPVAAPACLVAVNGKVGARKAFNQRAVAMTKGTKQTVRVTINKAAAKKLRKGGKLTVSALTGGSSLGVATKSVKVKRAR